MPRSPRMHSGPAGLAELSRVGGWVEEWIPMMITVFKFRAAIISLEGYRRISTQHYAI